MKTWARRTGVTLLILIIVAVLAIFVGKLLGERKVSRVVPVNVTAVTVTATPERIAHGHYLYATRGCADCHGGNGAGKTVVQDGGMLVVAPNITTGANSATLRYGVVDWVRTLRHGVKPNGQPVIVMPSEDYARLSDDDTAALIAYLQQLSPVPGEKTVITLPLPVKVLYGVGMIRDAAEKIDHTLPPATEIQPAVTPAYGAYVANTCTGCHGAKLEGGRIPGAPPAWPPAARLAPGKDNAMVHYTNAAQFMDMLKSGKRPDGTAVSTVMPFGSLGRMSDTDMRALYAYLTSLETPAPR
jgi:cytochrome c553